MRARLLQVAAQTGTPVYVYDLDEAVRRCQALTETFQGRFGLSYAVKANPNLQLLAGLLPYVDTLDVSSYREVERALLVGCPAERITFSGPAKRAGEVRGAVEQQIGELVLESVAEAELADSAARERGVRQPVLIRINPANGPKKFGVSFSGKASQFGVDEEVLDEAIDRIQQLPGLDLVGFHIYSGTNSLDPEAITQNFAIFIELFRRAAARSGIAPRKLVFGSGFGVPYGAGEQPLDIEAVAATAVPMIDELKRDPTFANARCVLELGRWLVAPAGWLLTGVIAQKHSRGTELRACDAGFNNHLAACGMMGTVIRRNWRFDNISNPQGAPAEYTLVGPLCTSIDVLASKLTLPEVRLGDVIAVENSGAYGLTASPTRFISHPEPAEVLLVGDEIRDATESALNTWTTVDAQGQPRSGTGAG
ncbi:alanine racemase [Phenylobacterium deserti]|uniref:Type III PLP-dependent enzyme n=1 Tax=Phenylobacterium deserti TaxID=1914756 RepID=A0A328ACM0_9CAUL|nr:alanine racemase [Phenylobacterium deserti]RAK52389.1 type III PLP-dependent enzyme [Phenylobacterium deserti]